MRQAGSTYHITFVGNRILLVTTSRAAAEEVTGRRGRVLPVDADSYCDAVNTWAADRTAVLGGDFHPMWSLLSQTSPDACSAGGPLEMAAGGRHNG